MKVEAFVFQCCNAHITIQQVHIRITAHIAH